MITAAQGKGYFRKRGFIEPLPRRWGVCFAIILGVTLGFKASAALPLEQLCLTRGLPNQHLRRGRESQTTGFG